ncbi:MAG TPA: hypothetical protein VGH32_03940, partial [Pirellulales bacterium]
VLVAFTVGPGVMHFRRAERANCAYGPAQRVAEWLHPGRREAPPLTPPTAWGWADSSIGPKPVSTAPVSPIRTVVRRQTNVAFTQIGPDIR